LLGGATVLGLGRHQHADHDRDGHEDPERDPVVPYGHLEGPVRADERHVEGQRGDDRNGDGDPRAAHPRGGDDHEDEHERGCRERDMGAHRHEPADHCGDQHQTGAEDPRGPQSCHSQIFARS
jgi:hypothetical protein